MRYGGVGCALGSLYPAPAPQSLEDDPRIAEVEEWAAGFEKVAPRLAAAHKLDPRGPEDASG